MQKILEYCILISVAGFLGLSYIAVYDLSAARKENSCKDDTMVRDIQIKSLIAIEKRMKQKGYKACHE